MKKMIPAIILFVFSLSFLFAGVQPTNASHAFTCSIELVSPSIMDVSTSVKIQVRTTHFDGNPNWKYVYSIEGPGDFIKGGTFQRGVLNVDLGFLQFNGNHTLKVFAANKSGAGDTDFDTVFCSGSPITIKVTGGEEPPEPPPPPSEPAPDPNCSLVFTNGSTETLKIINKDQTVSFNRVGDGTSGSVFVLKRGTTQLGEWPPKTWPHEAKFIFSGTSKMRLYNVVVGTPRVEHLCTGFNGGELIVVVEDTSGGTGEGAGEIVNIDPTQGEGGDVSVVAGNFASRFLTFGVGIGGGIAFLLMIFGAYRLTFAAGNPESIQQGQQIITAAIAGLLVIVFAVFILRFLGFTILGIGGLV